MTVNLHFVAKKSRAGVVAELLRAHGFRQVSILPGRKRVHVSTTPDELLNCLGVELEYAERETRDGSKTITPVVPPSADLPDDLRALVDRWFSAIPADRLGPLRTDS